MRNTQKDEEIEALLSRLNIGIVLRLSYGQENLAEDMTPARSSVLRRSHVFNWEGIEVSRLGFVSLNRTGTFNRWENDINADDVKVISEAALLRFVESPIVNRNNLT